MESIDLPKPTKKRLIQLLAILQKWPDKKITSVAISEASGWKSSLIRHDLWLLGFKKGVSNGYYIEELEQVIKSALNISFKKDTFMLSKKESNVAYTSDSSTAVVGSGSAEGIFKKVCIAGLGRLGASLLDQNLFDNSVFEICAGFDSNVNRVEILRSTFPLYPTSEMDFVIKREKINFAILTVADKDAQTMANRLIKAGISGIVNMTNVLLKVPQNVKVENLSIITALNLLL
ncbi:MAG: hypothetical protein MR739_13265 [Spirochaetia bacterium]|nr:hypothetical protein [Spirochaetia bacterium]MDD7610827.1 winged-helix domain-containing protein [Spirochaetales bacterium]MDY5915002.1 hypothetical protein [Treponema sp.]